MLAEYDRETTPGPKVIVSVSLDVRHATIHERDSTLHMLGDLKMVWNDQRLTWNATEWDCDTPLTSAERLWRPDVTILNAAATSSGDVGLRARLSSAGVVTWITRLDITVPVALMLDQWPSDVQFAVLKFGSRASSLDEMELVLGDTKHVVVFEASAWEIVSVSGSSSQVERGVTQISVASWTVWLRRRAYAHSLATSGVLYAVLLLLAAAGALKPALRAPAAACASFVSAMWLVSIVLRLPGSLSYPRVVSLMSVCCVCGALTTLAAALVVRVANITTQPPGWLRAFLLRISSTNMCNLTPDLDKDCSERNGTWCAAAAVIDNFFVVILWITMFILAIRYVA